MLVLSTALSLYSRHRNSTPSQLCLGTLTRLVTLHEFNHSLFCSVVGWLSLAATGFLLISLLLDPKKRQYPAGTILYTCFLRSTYESFVRSVNFLYYLCYVCIIFILSGKHDWMDGDWLC